MKKPKAKVKPVKAWAIYNPFSKSIAGGISYSRRDSQKNLRRGSITKAKRGASFYREGFRAFLKALMETELEIAA